jgi:hypothetical protein
LNNAYPGGDGTKGQNLSATTAQRVKTSPPRPMRMNSKRGGYLSRACFFFVGSLELA